MKLRLLVNATENYCCMEIEAISFRSEKIGISEMEIMEEYSTNKKQKILSLNIGSIEIMAPYKNPQSKMPSFFIKNILSVNLLI